MVGCEEKGFVWQANWQYGREMFILKMANGILSSLTLATFAAQSQSAIFLIVDVKNTFKMVIIYTYLLISILFLH